MIPGSLLLPANQFNRVPEGAATALGKHRPNALQFYAGPSDPNGSQTYCSSGTFNVSGLVDGDLVKVVMTVLDCGPGGHAGWAYLDGIGTVFEQPSPGGDSFPDGGTTLAMLGLALTGMAVRCGGVSRASESSLCLPGVMGNEVMAGL